MTAVDVPELMRDDEIERVDIVAASPDQIGIQHDKPPTSKAGGKGIQNAAGLQEIDVGNRVHADTLRDVDDAAVQSRQLVGPDLDRAAPQMRDEAQMREKEDQAKDNAVNQSDDGDDKQDPQRNRDDRYENSQRHFRRVRDDLNRAG